MKRFRIVWESLLTDARDRGEWQDAINDNDPYAQVREANREYPDLLHHVEWEVGG